uniref:Peptidase S1 domain-containing protein n=1 Tax=Pelodiscus sinensis TaxID=13735 RepID=K7F4F1_PELSI
MQLLFLGLLPWAFLLLPGGWAGEIIGGREAQPHSRPYMAFLYIQDGKEMSICGGSLVSKNFVLTAAHCWRDSDTILTVILGAQNITQREPSWYRPIPSPTPS